MTYEQWAAAVPQEIVADPLWKMESYRLGLFVFDLSAVDSKRLRRDPIMKEIAEQLFRAAGNISSNIAEGYSRGTGRDRARFYEYSLGSAREARDWYFKSRANLGPKVTAHRLEILTRLIKLLIKTIAVERRRNARLMPADR